jgi:putative ubiquitin-RnfH superfamily antitoxin RatB of RatAB toxin-antitoxin module
MRIEVAYVAPGTQFLVELDLPAGSTVGDAVCAAQFAERIGEVPGGGAWAIFGRPVAADTPLADGDRVEITRPLLCDPKTARRRRAGGSHETAPRGRRRARGA